MQTLIEYLIKAIVEDREAVQVTPVSQGHAIVYTVAVADADLGRVIGRQGRTAEALRTIVKAAGTTEQQSATLDILS